jgi:hypothetical protein
LWIGEFLATCDPAFDGSVFDDSGVMSSGHSQGQTTRRPVDVTPSEPDE